MNPRLGHFDITADEITESFKKLMIDSRQLEQGNTLGTATVHQLC